MCQYPAALGRGQGMLAALGEQLPDGHAQRIQAHHLPSERVEQHNPVVELAQHDMGVGDGPVCGLRGVTPMIDEALRVSQTRRAWTWLLSSRRR